MSDLRKRTVRLLSCVIPGTLLAGAYGWFHGVWSSVFSAPPSWQAGLFDGAVIGAVLLVAGVAEWFVPAVVGYAVYGGLAGLVGGVLFGVPLPNYPLPAGLLAALSGAAGGALAGLLLGFGVERLLKR